uniref:Putative secreted protein n=1 Tax=Anopheles marajoara TaxID=58244 RepID=A0A2M4C2X8_9DIPT
MDYSSLVASLLLFVALIGTSDAHECYVCSNQTGNTDKCLNTVRICEQGEDACLTEIRWGSTPYFSLGAQKQFYVSKRCAKKEICQRIRTKHMPYCTHIWYEDWTCSACCLGDRCNYYVISDAPAALTTSLMLLGSALAVFMVRTALHC